MRRVLIFTLVLLAFACKRADKVADLNQQKIKVVSNYYASLSWWGLKKLGFAGSSPDPKYWQWTDELSEAGKDIEFKAPVAGGPLFTFIYQIPGYLEPADVEEFDRIMDDCISFVKTGSISELKSNWDEKNKYFSEWYNPVYLDIITQEIGDNKDSVVKSLRLWKSFVNEIWDEYLPVYNREISKYPFDRINSYYRNSRIMDQWDSIFGVRYPYDKFVVCVCPESNTLASSLGPEKIVFGGRHLSKYLERSIIHEIGVRYFPFNEFANRKVSANIMRNDYENLIRLVETEVCYRKHGIINIENDLFLAGMKLEKLYEFRVGENQGVEDNFDFITRLYIHAKSDSIIK